MYSAHDSLVSSWNDVLLMIYQSLCFRLMILTLNCFHFNSIRSPGPVKPAQVECEGFHLTYTRIAAPTRSNHPTRASLENDVDQKVNQAIESFLRTLSQIGPELLSVRCTSAEMRYYCY